MEKRRLKERTRFPWRGDDERFLHSDLSGDCLRTLVLESFSEAEAYLAWAREDYNTIKPEQRLRWMTPSEYHEEVSVSAK